MVHFDQYNISLSQNLVIYILDIYFIPSVGFILPADKFPE